MGSSVWASEGGGGRVCLEEPRSFRGALKETEKEWPGREEEPQKCVNCGTEETMGPDIKLR